MAETVAGALGCFNGMLNEDIYSQLRAKVADIFNKLYYIKPVDPIGFMMLELGVPPLEDGLISNLEIELDDANLEIKRLKKILSQLGGSYDNLTVPSAGLQCFPPEKSPKNC